MPNFSKCFIFASVLLSLSNAQSQGQTFKEIVIKYKNVITTPRPWPAERLTQSLKKYPKQSRFRIIWFLQGSNFNQEITILYDRRKKNFSYYSCLVDYLPSKSGPNYSVSNYIWSGVTDNALLKVAEISKQSDMGTADASFFALTNLGYKKKTIREDD